MNSRALKSVVVLLGIVGATLLAKNILLQGLPAVALDTAPPLAGPVSQSLGTSGSNTNLPLAGKDYNLRDVRYFNSGQWAAATIVPANSTADTVFIIMQKINGAYQVVLGPGNDFSASYTYTLPPEVSQYLNQRGALNE